MVKVPAAFLAHFVAWHHPAVSPLAWPRQAIRGLRGKWKTRVARNRVEGDFADFNEAALRDEIVRVSRTSTDSCSLRDCPAWHHVVFFSPLAGHVPCFPYALRRWRVNGFA